MSLFFIFFLKNTKWEILVLKGLYSLKHLEFPRVAQTRFVVSLVCRRQWRRREEDKDGKFMFIYNTAQHEESIVESQGLCEMAL